MPRLSCQLLEIILTKWIQIKLPNADKVFEPIFDGTSMMFGRVCPLFEQWLRIVNLICNLGGAGACSGEFVSALDIRARGGG